MQRELNIRDPENAILLQAYEQDNYYYIDTDIDSDICYIFFSSNGLYYPNTEEVFRTQIVEKDRYEWKWVARNSMIYNRAGRVIFVRDIYKCWYVKGINSRTNTIDKTLELLKELTEGYRVITVGSSAGGYMAVLSAVKLNAVFCFNFSGQYHISRERDNPYCDLAELLKSYSGKIFYFVPAHHEADQNEHMSVQSLECIRSFLFNDDKHASTMLTGNMCYIVDRDEEYLIHLYERYCGKEIDKLHFLFVTVPFRHIFGILFKEIRGFLVRKLDKHWNGI